ncbi:MAG: hypothetical protein J5J00_07390 [Deltaproteobacteria bacterium]|nr:hypothetical protein [Deltaproteobacteria bacterium]
MIDLPGAELETELRHYCTYFDRNYLHKGLCLIESLREHESRPYKLHVVCMDEITRLILEELSIPNLNLIPMHDVERGDARLLACKHERKVVEYLWTCTPTVILRVLERDSSIRRLTYLDSDLFFFSSPDPIFQEAEQGSVLIHDHRFPPSKKHLEKFGKYNVGLLSFTREAIGVLDWWRERCLEWCYAVPEDGKFGDQAYLNDWPTRFKGVVDLKHIGAGLAPWNHAQYEMQQDKDGRISVDGLPLIFYHYHAFKTLSRECYLPLSNLDYDTSMELLRLVFLPYVQATLRAIDKAREIAPDFNVGFSAAKELTDNHTFIVTEGFHSRLKGQPVGQSPQELEAGWFAYISKQTKPEKLLLKESGVRKSKELKISGPAPIVMVNFGMQEHFLYAAAQARRMAPNANVVLLCDQQLAIEGVDVLPVDEYSASAQAFEEIYSHQSSASLWLELTRFKRWLILKEFMSRYRLDKIVHLDSDVLLFCDPHAAFAQLGKFEYALCGASAHISMLSNAAISEICNLFVSFFRNKEREVSSPVTQYIQRRRETNRECEIGDKLFFELLPFITDMNGHDMSGLRGRKEERYCFDSSFSGPEGVFQIENGVKKLKWIAGAPYGILEQNGELVRLKCIHYKGASKGLARVHFEMTGDGAFLP